MNIKGTIQDLQNNPAFYLFVMTISASLTVYMTQKFADVAYVNDQIKSIKQEREARLEQVRKELVEREVNFRSEIKDDLREVKENLKEQNKLILDMYKAVKHQESRR